MDRYDPYTDKFLRDTQYNILGTNLAEVGTDCISRQAAIDEAEEWIEAVYCDHEEQRERSAIKKVIQGIKCLPSAQPEIIYCKDCRKHNKKIGFDENFHTVWKEDACPLASWRGKAQGHEFDYQYCVYAERKVTE